MIIRKISLKILFSGIVLTTYLVLSFCLQAQSGNLSANKSKPKATNKTNKNFSLKNQGFPIKNNDKMVTVSVVNFGRKNPFQPYKKYSMVSGNLSLPTDIPPPPMFDPYASSAIKNLISAKVSGILYDPSGKSVAVINIKGSDYMVSKNNSVFGYYVENITRDKVSLRYNNNRYSVSVGEAVGINNDPVQRNSESFGGNSYSLPPIDMGEL